MITFVPVFPWRVTYVYEGEVDLSKGYWNPNRKLRGKPVNVSEVICFNLENFPYVVMYFKDFRIFLA